MSFLSFAQAHGLVIRDLREDGRIHRCPTEAKPRSDNGAYMLDRGRGWCMDWSQSDRVHWWQDEYAKPWTEQEKADALHRRRLQARERAQQMAKAAQDAQRMVGEARLVMPRAAQAWRPGRPAVEAIEAHPYLVRKGFPSEPGLVSLGQELLIPMYDAGTYRTLVGLQRIDMAGEKKFLYGQRAKGAIHRFGTGRAREVWLCEGYATGLSVRAALKALYRQADVVVCFSAGNIIQVASTGIGTHVMADNDASETGERAAIDTGLPYAMPAEVGTDANDLHQAQGIGAVVELVQRRI
jgi:putative DNA primase/helicase